MTARPISAYFCLQVRHVSSSEDISQSLRIRIISSFSTPGSPGVHGVFCYLQSSGIWNLNFQISSSFWCNNGDTFGFPLNRLEVDLPVPKRSEPVWIATLVMRGCIVGHMVDEHPRFLTKMLKLVYRNRSNDHLQQTSYSYGG